MSDERQYTGATREHSISIRVTRRRFLESSAALVAAIACTPSSTGPSATGAATALASPSLQPRAGGTLRIGTTFNVDTLDGHRLSAATANWRFLAHDALISYDAQRQPQPMLAESWDFSSDAKQIKLNLRKGVTFHSGREFTSEDVRYNIMRVRDAAVGASQLLTMSNWYSSVETPDKYTVILKSEQSRPATFDLLEFMNILDKENMDGPNAKTKVVGTGPFTFVESVPGDHMRFAKNKSYWQSGRPYLDDVVITIYKDTQALAVNLESGAIQAAIAPDLTDALRFRGDSKYQLLVTDIGNNYAIWANVTKPPTDNRKVRQALNYAIDRKRWAGTFLQNVAGEPRILPWPNDVPAYEARDAYGFDLDKARALLAEAGASNLQMDFIYPSTSQAPVDLGKLAQMYEQDVAKIGVKLSLKPLDLATFNSTVIGRNYSGMFLSIGGFTKVEPSSFFNISVAWRPAGNTPGYSSPVYTKLVNDAATEPDLAKRKAIYKQINDLILDESFAMMVSSAQLLTATRSTVHGLALRFTGYYMYTNIWLEA